MILQLLLGVVLWYVSAAAAAASGELVATNTKCQTSCGNISFQYPFGMGDDPTCFKDQNFKITCNDSKAYIIPNVEILNISLPQAQMTVRTGVSYECYGNGMSNFSYWINLGEKGPFTFSNTRNKFTAIGCDTLALVVGSAPMGQRFVSGCISSCSDNTTSIKNGSCIGSGCCQSNIPEGLTRLSLSLRSVNNRTNMSSSSDSNLCSYTFLVDHDQFQFYKSDLWENNFLKRNRTVPTVVDWVVGKETCQEAQRNNKSGYACLSENSDCYYSTKGRGYVCNCSDGYQGNPYVVGGCQDVDECDADKENYPCVSIVKICKNTPVGNYTCICPGGYHGDGRIKGNGCMEDAKKFPVTAVFTGIGLSLLFLIMASTWTYWVWRKRKSIKLKEKFFQQNGGFLLQQKISSQRAQSFKIFTLEELKMATDNYNPNNIVGQGGYGIVYKGTLPNNRIVAIKKSKIVDASQIEQFINEVDILSQINHRNVVKLLGCCLEDQVPLLVYEFVSNGTLAYHIHDVDHTRSIPLQGRLRIAVETAEALAYLHSAASMPIFHRDVKSTNILLDDNFTAKVSDFGASRLVSIDQTQIATLVQGTLGYLDPEYFQTGQLTAKSDVYSFGVVLVELLTAEKPVSFSRSQKERNLAMHFISAMKENRLLQVLEERVLKEGREEQLMAIARVAKRCLGIKGEERPTMKEVVVELQGLRGFQEHPWLNNNKEEIESLLGKTSQCYTGDASGQYNSESHLVSALEIGR